MKPDLQVIQSLLPQLKSPLRFPQGDPFASLESYSISLAMSGQARKDRLTRILVPARKRQQLDFSH